MELEVIGPATQQSVLDALELATRCCRARSATRSRSSAGPFVRFFACEEDLSHEPPDAPLPEAVVDGTEPFFVVGAMAGG